MSKAKLPLKQAQSLSDKILAALADGCERAEVAGKLGIAMKTELCYTRGAEVTGYGAFCFSDAVESQYIIVGKAPSVCGLTSRQSPQQRRQAHGGRFVMKDKTQCKICGKEFFMVTHSHLREHRISTKEYIEKYGPVVKERLTCTVDGCARIAHGQGLCNRHYKRWRENGTLGHKEWKPKGGTWQASETDLAYMAAFIDGEGTIGYKRYNVPKKAAKYQYTASVEIANTNPIVPRIFQSTFGGYVRLREPLTEACKPLYTWSSAGRNAIELLKMVAPYLRMKHRQAELLLNEIGERYPPGGRKSYPPEVWEHSEDVYQQIKFLNKRGALTK